jgi:hypothetical protein
MQCEHCNFDNVGKNLFCQRCGAPLPILIPYEPSIEDYVSPPSEDYETLTTPANVHYYHPLLKKIKISNTFKLIRSLFFFLVALPLTSFGIFSTFSAIGSDTRTVCSAFFLVIGVTAGSIITFYRTRHRYTYLRWPSFIFAVIGATFGAFIAFCFEIAVLSDGISTRTGTIIACSIVTLYGLILEGIALC